MFRQVVIITLFLIGIGGCAADVADVEGASADLRAAVNTTVHDGTEDCTPLFLDLVSCTALDGVSHTTVDGAGREHFVFNGSRAQRLYRGEVLLSEIYTEEHRVFLVDEDGIVMLHADGCLEIDGGRFSVDFYTHVVNGEVVRTSVEFGADCGY